MLLLLSVACQIADDPAKDDTDDSPTDTGTRPIDTAPDTEHDDCDRFDGEFFPAWWIGSFASDGTTATGTLGAAIQYWDGDLTDTCSVAAAVTSIGPPATECPDCEWAFEFSPRELTTEPGPYCHCFTSMMWGNAPFENLAVEGNGYSWGFAEMYYYDYNGTVYPLEDVVMLDVGDGWFPFAWGDYDYPMFADGDASSVEFGRVADGYQYFAG